MDGEACGHILTLRGSRQEDPFSPFIFFFCSKGLSCLLSKAKREGLVKGLSFGYNGTKMTHLLFANDSLMFLEANMDEGTILIFGIIKPPKHMAEQFAFSPPSNLKIRKITQP